MKKYLTISKNSFIAGLIYKVHFFFTVFGNIIYIMVIYFLWKSIFKNSGGTINGMTFHEVFIYLALASSLVCLFQTYTEWDMSHFIITGTIIKDLTKPLDHQLLTMFGVIGFALNNLVAITIPSMVVIFLIAGFQITFGINILFFILSLVMAFLITFAIDYSIGLIAFYTESIWGISIAKGVVVALLSGTLIPLSFFPQTFKKIVEFLPFQAIYNTPVSILISKNLELQDYFGYILNQIFWVAVLFLISRLFFKKAIKVITVNGG